MSSFDDHYHLVLYIDSAKPRSYDISERLRQLCKRHLPTPFTLEVIDLRKEPALLEQRRIIAVPTLDVTTPQAQQHRFVGDLSVSKSFIVATGMFLTAENMQQNATKMKQNISNFKSNNK
ncbi:MAG: circadian clock protein KaiB [Candidatus Thiodiazotropha taylori]|nr:circadian clock protein KaiB [Candidatus Thiodiazotropha taylori]